jgi:hypothetical protein
MGIITSRRTWSKPSFVGSNLAGVSLGKVPGEAAGGGVWAAAGPMSHNRQARIPTSEVKERTLFLAIGDHLSLPPSMLPSRCNASVVVL